MKKLKVLLVIMLTCIGIVGCSSSKLDPAYDEEKLKSDSQGIVHMFCNEEYDKIVEKMTKDMESSITSDKLKEVWEPLKTKLGKFESISKEAVVGKQDLATVVVLAEFENGKAQFTITYNKDMKLEGLYIK